MNGLNVLTTLAAAVQVLLSAVSPQNDFFFIEALDEQTGRGIPMVELRTTSQIRLLTDSGGLAAFYEPGLMNQPVFFFVESPGYEFPADGFGIRGTVLETCPGKTAVVHLKRLQIAERLYRLTGQGIYRDSILAARPVPLRQPLLNAQVCGQDSVNNGFYKGRLYWFWGDTNRLSYALGQFATSGAVSELPQQGGLPPEKGVDLTYFVDQNGFSKPMFPLPEPGMVWIDGVLTVRQPSGREVMLCHFSRMKDLSHCLERGIGIYNETENRFEPIRRDCLDRMPYDACGHPFPVLSEGIAYWYFAVPFPLSVRMRVRAAWPTVCDPNEYEVFTALDRPNGSSEGHWIRFADLVRKLGSLEAARIALRQEHQKDLSTDVQTGKTIEPHAGSVFWNAWRNRWIMIFNQAGGDSSYLGEVWYAEAPTPVGPWTCAQKIITHNQYSFYNLKQHPYFDQEQGRMIYLEGTCSTTFSCDSKQALARYDYNQIMYRVDLSDNRLKAVWQTVCPFRRLSDPNARPDPSAWPISSEPKHLQSAGS